MPAVSVPSPTGGWNARDSRDKMEPTDAVKLINWVPRAGYCETRKGTAVHATGLGGSVESLIAYRGPGTSKLLGAANANIWDVTTAGAAVSIKAALSSNVWNYTHHSGVVVMCNGLDTPQVYNGTTIVDIVATGPTVTTLWGVNNYKGRNFYWAKNSQSFWYAAANSYQGALTEFNLSRIAKQGGYIVQMLTWTLDAGDGVNDLAAFVMSTGEVLIYQGDDPGTATSWALSGSFSIGEPISIRAHARVAGTEIIATKDGYLDLGKAIIGGRYNEESAYSNKIIQAAKSAAVQYSGIEGWACLLYPAGNMFIVNVPLSTTTSIQHVRDTTNGGWCQFNGWNIRSMAVHSDRLYYGDPTGVVYFADTGYVDNVTTPITTEAIPAFNALGSRARQKQLTAMSVVSSYLKPQNWVLDGLADFNLATRSTLNNADVSGESAWDVATWDVDPWASTTFEPEAGPRGWRNVRASGFALTASIRLNLLSQPVTWFSTAYLYKDAGAL
jgi:hypothetical protein